MSKFKGTAQKSKVKTGSEIKSRSYYFSVSIVKLVSNFKYNMTTKVIGDQLLRSSTSIAANVIEAKSASSRRDFIKFYEYALKSSNETKYWLCLLKDTDLENMDKVDILLKEAIEISNILASIVLSLKGKKKT